MSSWMLRCFGISLLLCQRGEEAERGGGEEAETGGGEEAERGAGEDTDQLTVLVVLKYRF